MENKDINELQENLDNQNINIKNKINGEKEENDIANIIKTKRKNSNNQKSNEKNNEIIIEKNEENFWNKDNFGILSNLKNLNIDDSQINKNNEKDTPTPSGLKEFKLNIIKIIDDDSKRNNQKKNSNSPFLNDNKKNNNFSSFLKNNVDNYNQYNSNINFDTSNHNNDFFSLLIKNSLLK